MDRESPHLRLSILGVVVVSLIGTLFARLWYLQVMAAPEYQVEAQANRVRTIAEEAPRGRILDAKGRVIVDNRTSLVVTVNPHDLQAVPDSAALKRRLAETLTRFGVPTKVSTIERRLGDKQYNPLQPVPVAIDVPEELFLYLSERADEFPSVGVRRESVRAYPYGETAAHLLGYVGRISAKELADKQGTPDNPKPTDKPYQPDSNIGKNGVERSYEDDLRGRPGIKTVEVDAQNRVVRTIDEQPPVPGHDIQLTVDLDVQRLAEQVLRDKLDSIRGSRTRDGRLRAAPAGAVVVLDPNNGNVVAMASAPTYNPEEFVNGISQTRYDQLTGGAASENPFINRAIQGQYAPGSTFKPITAYAALSHGLIDRTTTYNDRGSYDAGDRVFGSPSAAGPVNVARSLTVSSDVFYYWLGHRFYRERDVYGELAMQDAAYAFGLGRPTGIPLVDERAGNIPTPEWKRKIWESLPPDEQAIGDPTWYPGDNINMSIGQGDVLVTPLQLANVYAALANGGTIYQPNVVARVLRSPNDPVDPGGVVRVVEPVVEHQVPLPPEIRDPIVQGLRGVTTDPKGTAYAPFRGFDQAAFPVASKTGTAEVKGKADSSWFAAFAPVDAPRYAMVAILEESGFGAEAAAPVVRSLLELVSGQRLTDLSEISGGSE
ncbi:penicillin-binding protein 2 [Rhabdothermincola sp.]|uniref:penicillin-binding protein 2 n=1 Tax=Rhabdothermincola sp. TaxID=2820405 RepID=UPI002FE37FCF